MHPLITCLWFDGNAVEAAEFYTSVFDSSALGKVVDNVEGTSTPDYKALTVEFEIRGQKFLGLNAGPHFKFNEAISIMLPCDTQEEIDHYWNVLTANGGAESQCGWLKDKFGLSWQIIPSAFSKMINTGTKAQIQAMMDQVMQMTKLDIARMENAWKEAA